MAVVVSFGAWLRQRRKALDLTQEDLALRVGCSVSAIRKFEANERRPSRQIAELLAENLEISQLERATFLKVARAELRVDRLASPVGRRRPAPVSRAQIWKSRPAFHPLPMPPTPLVGRQMELAELALLLQNPQCRLLTLVGPGGIGKTRLALQAAWQAANEKDCSWCPSFPDGVSFISLTSLSDADSVVPAIAEAVQCDFYGSGNLKLQLLNALRDRTMLLVLDNAEHLLTEYSQDDTHDFTGLLAEILSCAPRIKILVTSRERLNLLGEWVFEIYGLPVPPGGMAEGIEAYSAVALFLQSARRVWPGFQITQDNREAVIHICQYLDGMPLGIELAAAWTRILSCEEIVAEIQTTFDFLEAAARDLPERHRSLRTVFEDSWALLSAEEQDVLRKLSVFRGSFRREAVFQVTGTNLAVLTSLVDKSLLRRPEAGRYDLHELVRQYAAEKLQAEPPERDQNLERFSTYYLEFLHEREDRLTGNRRVMEEIRAELENIRDAWEWALAHDRFDLIEIGCSGLTGFYRSSGLLHIGEAALRQAVERLRERMERPGEAGAQLKPLMSRLLAGQASLLNDLARFSQAGEAANLAIEFARETGDTSRESNAYEAAAYLELGRASWRMLDYTAARWQLETALGLARSVGGPRLEASTLAMLGTVAVSQSRMVDAMAQLEEALHLFQVLGDRQGESAVLNRIGTAYYAQGYLQQAGDTYERAFAIFVEIGDRRGEAMGLNNLGVIRQALGDHYRAKGYYERTLPIFAEIGDRWGESAALGNLGSISTLMGDFSRAKGFYEQAIQICREIGESGGEVAGISSLGLLAYYLGDLASAREYQQRAVRMAAGYPGPELPSLLQLRLGRIWFDLGEINSAETCFRQALDLRGSTHRVNLTLEPLAGLAWVSLSKGDLDQACCWVEDILAALGRPECNPLDNTDDPYWVYLTCISILRAAGDPRSGALLHQGHEQLQSQAAQIGDLVLRRAFLENLPANRALLREWQVASGGLLVRDSAGEA